MKSLSAEQRRVLATMARIELLRLRRYRNPYWDDSWWRGLCVDCVRRTSALFCFHCNQYTSQLIEGEERSCPACGGELHWLRRCAACAQANENHRKLLVAERRAAGQCPYCFRSLRPGYLTCGNH